mmetsp:Transcript_13695/g.34955  ORF Transcript_13695/g.34955 Transcript_13695/m.34955 type:complete len:329 (+) Transcript_13695:571-1557(+)
MLPGGWSVPAGALGAPASSVPQLLGSLARRDRRECKRMLDSDAVMGAGECALPPPSMAPSSARSSMSTTFSVFCASRALTDSRRGGRAGLRCISSSSSRNSDTTRLGGLSPSAENSGLDTSSASYDITTVRPPRVCIFIRSCPSTDTIIARGVSRKYWNISWGVGARASPPCCSPCSFRDPSVCRPDRRREREGLGSGARGACGGRVGGLADVASSGGTAAASAASTAAAAAAASPAAGARRNQDAHTPFHTPNPNSLRETGVGTNRWPSQLYTSDWSRLDTMARVPTESYSYSSELEWLVMVQLWKGRLNCSLSHLVCLFAGKMKFG